MSDSPSGVVEPWAATTLMNPDTNVPLIALVRNLTNCHNRRDDIWDDLAAQAALGRDLAHATFEELCEQMGHLYNEVPEADQNACDISDAEAQLLERAAQVDLQIASLQFELMDKESKHLKEIEAQRAEVLTVKKEMADFVFEASVAHLKDKLAIREYEAKLEHKPSAMTVLHAELKGARDNLARHLDIQNKFESKIVSMQMEINQCDAVVHEKISDVQSKDELLAKVYREHKEELVVKDNEIAAAAIAAAEKEEVLQAELSSLRNDLGSFSNMLDLKADKVCDLSQEQDRLVWMINHVNSTLEMKEKTISELTKSVHEQNQTLKDQAKRVDELLNNIGHTAAVTQSQDRELNRLTKVVDDRNKEIVGLKWRVNVLDVSLEDAEERVTDLLGDLNVATIERSNVCQRLSQRIVTLETDINRSLKCTQKKDEEIFWLRKQLVKETGVEVAEEEEINFIASHFGHSVMVEDSVDDEEFGGSDIDADDFIPEEGSEPEQLTIPFVLNDGDLRRFATKEEMQGNINPQVVELQSPMVQDYFRDLWKTASEDSEADASADDDETGVVKTEDADLTKAAKGFYVGDEDKGREVVEAKASPEVNKNITTSIRSVALVDEGIKESEDWDVVSVLFSEGE